MKTKRKRFFVEGDEVAHKDNLTLKMTVERIIKYKKMVTVYGKKEKEEMEFISGIRCGWWNNNEWKRDDFFSNHLVPWNIAVQGTEKVIEYLQQN